MTIQLPERCMRGCDECQPLSLICSDDNATFVCCGKNDRSDDPYRVCFKSLTTDSTFDHDELDLLDQATVMIAGMAIARRLAEDEHACG